MSQRNSGRERLDADRYFTPTWCTEALLPHLPERIHTAWEPAAGSLKMVDVLARRFIVPATDIATGHDFLTFGAPLATEFCEHALRLMEPVGGVVAMLLRTDFDHAKSRAHLFRDCPAFAKKLVLTKRIVWFEPEPGSKGKSPSFTHCFFIWDWTNDAPPTIAYGP